VYATGISNGGIFSHYLAAHLSARIAAIAPVVGGIADPPEAWLRPEQPVSVLMLQGTRDPLVPYRGGAVAFGRGKIIDTEEAARRWAALNGGREPVREPLPADGKDRCGGLRTIYPGGRDGSEVTLVRLDGGGHTWPGGAQYLPQRLIGRVCRDFDATVLIWDFFKAHPKPGGP
jgi:polyhydroxybutyrate depolymerase